MILSDLYNSCFVGRQRQQLLHQSGIQIRPGQAMFHILFDTSQIQHITKITNPKKTPSQIQTTSQIQHITNLQHHKSASSQSQQITQSQQKFTKTKHTKQHHKSNKTLNIQKKS